MGIISQSILTEGELSPLQIDSFKGWEKIKQGWWPGVLAYRNLEY